MMSTPQPYALHHPGNGANPQLHIFGDIGAGWDDEESDLSKSVF